MSRCTCTRCSKSAVVRDDDQHAFVVAKISLQPVHESSPVVRRFVEQQRLGCQRAPALAARALSAAPSSPICARAASLHAKAVEQHRRVRLRRYPPSSPTMPRVPQDASHRVRQFVVRLAYSASRSSSAFHRGALPIMTVSITGIRQTQIGLAVERPSSSAGDRSLSSRLPSQNLINVDLPAPFGP